MVLVSVRIDKHSREGVLPFMKEIKKIPEVVACLMLPGHVLRRTMEDRFPTVICLEPPRPLNRLLQTKIALTIAIEFANRAKILD